MRKFLILSLAILMVLILISWLPYKIPGNFDDENCLEFIIVHSQGTNGLSVIEGSKFIDSQVNKLSDKSIIRDELNLTGRTPGSELNIDYIIFYYNRFKVYGTFVDGKDRNNILTLDVKEWYPVNGYIFLCTTYLWNDIQVYILESYIL